MHITRLFIDPNTVTVFQQAGRRREAAKMQPADEQKAVVVEAVKLPQRKSYTSLRNLFDDNTKRVFEQDVRGKTDQFVLKFRKPAK